MKSGLPLPVLDTLGMINGPTVIQNEKLQITVNRALLVVLYQFTKQKILNTVSPLAEKWADVKLTPTSVYGIRRYRNMSTLLSHMDKSTWTRRGS